MKSDYQVIIVGAGVVGLTAGLAISKKNLKVAVIDNKKISTDTANFDNRVYAINRASKKLLEELSVWKGLPKSRISPYTHMHVWDSVSNAAIDLDARDVGEPNLGFIIEEMILKASLIEQIKQSENIALISEMKIDAIESDEMIHLHSHEKSWTADFLIIADGAHSTARKLLDVKLDYWSYHQQALVARVEVGQPHHKTAYQVFNPDGPLAFLPLSHPQQCSIVWSVDQKKADYLKTLEDNTFCKELENAFSLHLGKVKLLSPRFNFSLQMQHVQHYVGKNWMLVGDAAHTIHPLAGLGLNLGLADVQSCLNLLNQHRKNPWSKKMLQTYQRHRKYEVWQIILLMESFKQLFGNALQPVVSLRGLGLKLCNNSSFLKRLCIEFAM